MKSLVSDLSFDKIWKELGECYRSLNIRCIAVKEKDIWRNICLIAFLSRKNIEDIKKETEHDYSYLRNLNVTKIQQLAVLYDVLDAKNLPHYIEQMQDGMITLVNQPVHLREGYERAQVYSRPKIVKFGEYSEYPFISYEFYSHEIARISDNIRNRLLSLGLLNTLDELGLQWLKIPELEGYSINVIIVLPLYFNVIDSFIQKSEEFYIKFKAHKNLQSKLGILFALRKHVGENRYLTIENNFFNSDDIPCHKLNEDFLICEAKYAFKALPNLNDEAYFRIVSELGVLSDDRRTIRNLMKRVEFKEEFLNLFTKFMNIDNLKEMLQGKNHLLKGKKAPDLEFQRAISFLLSLMNFKSAELGDTKHGIIKRSDGSHIGDVDIIAQDIDTRKMYGIQCTISPPDSRKIDVIANIANELRMHGVPIEPLMFVRDFATEVKKNVRRVNVIDIEDLLNVIQKLQEENVEKAKRLIIELSP